MADPARLYRFLPDCFDRDEDSDQYKLLAGLAKGTEDARTELLDYRNDLATSTANGEGLDRWCENFATPRPPGMLDSRYRAVTALIAGARRGTLAIIKQVLDAATGLTWTVVDRMLDIDQNSGALAIPAFEIWAKASLTDHPLGLAYTSYTTHVDGHPEESGLSGPILSDIGLDGGRFNDHTWDWLSWWELELVDRVRPAGTRVLFKDFTWI